MLIIKPPGMIFNTMVVQLILGFSELKTNLPQDIYLRAQQLSQSRQANIILYESVRLIHISNPRPDKSNVFIRYFTPTSQRILHIQTVFRLVSTMAAKFRFPASP